MFPTVIVSLIYYEMIIKEINKILNKMLSSLNLSTRTLSEFVSYLWDHIKNIKVIFITVLR